MKHIGACLVGVLVISAACGVAQDGAGTPKGEAKTAFEDVIKQMLETMDSLSTTLATIRDEETAKVAQVELRKATGKWQLIKKNAERL